MESDSTDCMREFYYRMSKHPDVSELAAEEIAYFFELRDENDNLRLASENYTAEIKGTDGPLVDAANIATDERELPEFTKAIKPRISPPRNLYRTHTHFDDAGFLRKSGNGVSPSV